MNGVFIILQVRLRSTRLPQKLLFPLCGISMFEHIVRRLLVPSLPEKIIVATTADTLPSIEKTSEKLGAAVMTGSEDDVLSRFADAVRLFDVKTLVRATGDNPLVSMEYVDRAVDLHVKSSAHLTSFPRLPYGTGVEVVEAGCLLEAHERAADPHEREHITQYIYRHPDEYSIVRGDPDKIVRRPELRLTVDTKEDYLRVRDIYEHLYRGEPIRLPDVIAYLDGTC